MIATVIVGAVALAVLVGTARAATTTRIVDDDGAQCSTATYTTIDDAIADANPGDTVVVCPGDYAAATVSTRVTLRGFTPDLSSPSSCASTAAANTSVDSIVAGLTVGVNQVTITGFTFANASDGILVPGDLRNVDSPGT